MPAPGAPARASLISLLTVLLAAACPALTAPGKDAGAGGGVGGGGTGGGAMGGGAGGGAMGGGGGAMGGGAGGGAMGGGGGGATGGGGGALGPGDYFQARTDAGLWLLEDLTPSSPPQTFTSLGGLAVDDVWAGAEWGEIWHFDGSAWTQVYKHSTTGFSFDGLTVTPQGRVVAVGGSVAAVCGGNCGSVGNFAPQTVTGLTFHAVCSSGGTVYAVGTDSTSIWVYTLQGASFVEWVQLPAGEYPSDCVVSEDGALYISVYKDVLRVDRADGGVKVETFFPALTTTPTPPYWSSLVESQGRLFVAGLHRRVGQRRADGGWGLALEVGSGNDQGWYYDVTASPSGHLLVGGLRSGAFVRAWLEGDTWHLLPDPVDTSIYAVYAPSDTVHFLAGERDMGTGSYAGRLYRATRR